MSETPNHEYNVPDAGTQDWHTPLNENFETLDTGVEIRDTDSNRSDYEPKDGAKFLATDTGTVYIGDGDDWNAMGSVTDGPIAKGWITEDGSIENALNVDSAQWNESRERYQIQITGEYYWFDEYVTVVTPVDHLLVRTTSNSGDLIVEFRDLDGNLIQTQFQFVTFDLPSGIVTTADESEATAPESTEDDGRSEAGAIDDHLRSTR